MVEVPSKEEFDDLVGHVGDVILDLSNVEAKAEDAAGMAQVQSDLLNMQGDQIDEILATLNRLRKRLKVLEDGVVVPKREPLFAPKPEPNTEAEYAASSVRAGVTLPIHNHYATSWSDSVRIVNACTAKVCRVTVASAAVDAAAIASYKDGIEILLGCIHEADAAVANNRVSLPVWRAAQEASRAAVDAANVNRTSKIVFGLCLTGYCVRGLGGRNPDDYFMDGVHEYFSSDFYTELMAGPGPQEFKVTPEQAMGATVDYAALHKVPAGIMEWGIHADDVVGGERAALMRSVNAYAREHEFLCVLYWDHGSNYCRNDDEFAAAAGM